MLQDTLMEAAPAISVCADRIVRVEVHRIKHDNGGVMPPSFYNSTQMQPNTIYYHLTASEFDWQLSEHKTIRAWGFNQQLPGPVINAKKGDTVVVRVKNELNESTIIHWHGIKLPAPMDGTGESQKPIQPGEEFEYRFIVPDAGTFWYHSHHNETVQMERGMYGALIVHDDSIPDTDRDRIFMIDDMKLSPNN